MASSTQTVTFVKNRKLIIFLWFRRYFVESLNRRKLSFLKYSVDISRTFLVINVNMNWWRVIGPSITQSPDHQRERDGEPQTKRNNLLFTRQPNRFATFDEIQRKLISNSI